MEKWGRRWLQPSLLDPHKYAWILPQTRSSRGAIETSRLNQQTTGKGRPATRPLFDPAEGWIATLLGNDVAVNHAVLLGYSLFDNAACVAGTPDVVRQVRRWLPQGFAIPCKSLQRMT
jgi:hypothetical protein